MPRHCAMPKYFWNVPPTQSHWPQTCIPTEVKGLSLELVTVEVTVKLIHATTAK